MNFTEEKEDRIEPLVRAFKEYCAGKVNIIIIRYRFNTHVQGTGDTATFITGLKDMISDCVYSPVKDSVLRDRIVAGVQSVEL